MKKTILLGYEKNRTQKTKRWLGLLTFCMMIFGQLGLAQISHTHDWEIDMGGWTSTGSGTFSRITTTPCDGTASARANNWYGNESFLVSPALTGTDGDDLTVEFDYKVTNFNSNTTGATAANFGSIKVEWATATSGPWTTALTITSAEHIVSASCANKTVTFSGLPSSGNVYVRFVAQSGNSSADNYVYFDNVVISQGPPPACPAPTALTATNISLTGATLGWTSDGDDFEVEWGATGFVQGSTDGTIVTVNGATSYDLIVTEGGDYQFYVRQDCGTDGYSTWAGPFSFHVFVVGEDCSAPIVIGTLPYTTTDDTANYGDNPNIEGAPGASCSTNAYLNGNDVVYAYTADADGAILIRMTPTATYSGIFAYADCADIGTDCIGGVGNSETTVREFELNVEEGETYYLVISTWATPQTTAYTLEISQILCAKPTDVTHTGGITHNTATISWESTGTDFEINWGTGTFDAGDGDNTETVTGETSATLTPLTPGTAYRYFVRQNCGGTDGDSDWVGPYTFTTHIATPAPWTESLNAGTTAPAGWTISGWEIKPTDTRVPNLDGNFIYKNLYGSYPAGTITTISVMDIEEDYELMFNYLIADWSDFPAQPVANSLEIEVKISTDYGTTYTTVETLISDGTTEGWQSFSYDLSAYEGEVVRVQIVATRTADDFVLAFDNFYIGVPPTCAIPTALTATNITSDSADLGWTSDGTDFDIKWDETGFDVDTEGTLVEDFDNGDTLSGLDPATAYEFYVRQDCGTDGLSEWAGPFAFTTECLPPSVLTTTPGTVCGEGTIELSATTDAGATLAWYTAQTGGTKLGEGAAFTTPSITETTSYWVEAYTGGGIQSAGKLEPNPASTAFITTNWGIQVVVNEAVTLESVSVYSTSEGALNVKITDDSGVELYETGNISVANGGLTTPTIIPLNYAAAEGNYRILVKSYTGVNLIRDSEGLSFPYVGDDGAVSVTASEWGGSTTGSYYFFYDLQYGSNCSSTRTEVIATVTDAPDFELSSEEASICVGETTSAVTITTGGADYDTFVWEPTEGVSGDATTGWTFNPTETTTYTLTAQTDDDCTTTVTYEVTVNELPSLTVVPTSAEICSDATTPVALETGGTVTISFGTDLESPGTAVTFPAEITGIPAGMNITSAQLQFTNVTAVSPSWRSEIRVALSGAHTLAATQISTLESSGTITPDPVIELTGFTATSGTINLILSETYDDSGTDATFGSAELVITYGTSEDVTWSPVDGLFTDAAGTVAYTGTEEGTVYALPTATTTYTATATTTGGCTATDTVEITVNEAPVIDSIVASATEVCEGTEITLEVPVNNNSTPLTYCNSYFDDSYYEHITNVTFAGINNSSGGNDGNPVNYTSQVANVTVGTASTLSVTIEADSDEYIFAWIDWNQDGILNGTGETYTLATDTSSTGPHTLSITPPATALNGNTRMRVMVIWNESIPDPCFEDWWLGGFGEAEDYTVNVSGGVGTDTLTYSWSDGTSEVGTGATLTVTPTTTTTYTVTATNTTGCTATESVTITVNEAPEEPVTACYETATFNPATCSWDITGTQPAEPTDLACFETAEFNDATCTWDITGTQPAEPTDLACYETAEFNDATCSWDITGTQPAEPTDLACYETAEFNDATCSWDITGTAPTAPTADSPQTLSDGQTVANIVITDVTGTLNWYDEDMNEIEDDFVLSEGTYTFYVSQTIDGCESDAIEVVVEVTLSTSTFDNASFRAYPNPVKDFFNVSYSKDITGVEVINMLGQVVITKTVNATDSQIDMTSLPTGNYLVKVNINDYVKVVKVVKQ